MESGDVHRIDSQPVSIAAVPRDRRENEYLGIDNNPCDARILHTFAQATEW
jgi:hypothetical protein